MIETHRLKIAVIFIQTVLSFSRKIINMNNMNLRIHISKYIGKILLDFCGSNQICITYFPRNKKHPFATRS